MSLLIQVREKSSPEGASLRPSKPAKIGLNFMASQGREYSHATGMLRFVLLAPKERQK